MHFEFRDESIDDYLRHGYVVFRRILPPTLVRDLRREGDKARALAHELHGPQAQRLQPVERYADRLDLRPFRDYCELPALRDAVARLLGPDRTHGHTHIMGILVEPAEKSWCLGWHRDFVVEVPPEAYDAPLRAKLAEVWHDLRLVNQVNCALYPDACTWYVPGSHLRQLDLPEEEAAVTAKPREAAGRDDTEAELEALAYCRNFPGAVQVYLDPGDYMLYRNHAWHAGNYRVYQPRATIHDAVLHTPTAGWGQGWQQAKREALERMKTRQALALNPSPLAGEGGGVLAAG